MRICVVGPAYPYRGGIAHHTTLMCRHLAARHEVRAVSFRRLYPGILFPGQSQIESGGTARILDAEPLIDSINPLTWSASAEHIRTFHPDLVVIQWWQPFFAPCMASLASKVKEPARVVFLCHNVLPHEGRSFAAPIARWALRHGDGFIVHSEQDLADIRRLFPAARVRKSIHPVCELFSTGNTSRAEARTRLVVGGKVILFFGLVRKYKGLMDLVDAMALVRSEDLTCIIAGEFYDRRSRYTSRIGQLGLGDRIRVVDRYIPNEEVPNYFMAADLIVLPYRTATQSGVVQIANRFQRPALVTSVGGLPETIDDGVNGMVVPPNNPAALAAAIDRYFDEGLESRLVEGIRRNNSRFSWDRLLEDMESLGAELCAQR